jgi:hypothetical protein
VPQNTDASQRVSQPVASTQRTPQRLGPVETTPRALFDDFTRPDADRIALVDKYAGGVSFTATIKTVGSDDEGAPVVWIDIDGENVMSLEFARRPDGLRAGALLSVTCRIGGASGALMMVTSCLVRDV